MAEQELAKGPVFAIVISEKGGAERREAFEHAEVTIGRVQGNELMLPKGNVSKRHARLVFRDGRFIVTDLNSTNGTYVNRRRISQATIVRHGDRIYIGDFVIRVEGQEDSNAVVASRPSVSAIPLREPMMTAPDASSRSRPPGPPPSPALVAGYPPLPRAPRVPAGPESEASPAHTPSSEPSVRMDMSAIERPPSGREDSIDTDTTAYRGAVAALVTAVLSKVEPRLLEREIPEPVVTRVERTIIEQLAVLRQEDVVGAAIVDERLRKDVRAELLELGAIGSLLGDESVSEIAVTGGGVVVAIRGSRRVPVEPPLSSEASVRRILGRLARLGGAAPGSEESLIVRRLPGGFSLTALTGSRATTGTLLRLERPQRVDATFEDLVRAGAVSRAVATFLRHCVAVRANVLVVGARDSRPSTIAGALASASPDGQVVALQVSDAIVSNAVSVSNVDVSGTPENLTTLVQFAAKIPDARLVVDDFSGVTAAAVLEAVTGGTDGLVAVLGAASLRRGLARLPADIATARPGLTVEAAREWVAGTFDLMIDVARLRDGRQRVVRVAEPVGVVDGEIALRDIFTFVVERTATGGSVEGTFQATGVAPRIVNDMSARGIHVDSGVFSRPPSR